MSPHPVSLLELLVVGLDRVGAAWLKCRGRKLVRAERHDFVSRAAIGAIILVPEGDAVVVGGDAAGRPVSQVRAAWFAVRLPHLSD